ncbi:MAG: response regulator [Betaproteobacteria bacterium]|nr:response regulator [Betaproteobacteria bacterium]
MDHVEAATPEFLTTREAAQRLGVALRTAQLWVESGALPAWKTVGGHRRIPRTAVEAMRSEQRGPGGLNACSPEPLRLLVLEGDEAALRRLRETAAALQPLELRAARDGFDALLAVPAWRPHLLLTDLFIPGMDGFRMLRALRADPDLARLQILVVTALGESDIAERGGLPAGVRVLPKPMPADEFVGLVRGLQAARR